MNTMNSVIKITTWFLQLNSTKFKHFEFFIFNITTSNVVKQVRS